MESKGLNRCEREVVLLVLKEENRPEYVDQLDFLEVTERTMSGV